MEEWFKSESNGSDVNYGDLASGSQYHEGSFFFIFSFVTGWVDVMSVPILGLSLGYMYHPMYPSPKFEVPRGEELPCDPTQWEPDVISLELEAGPAALKVFGSLLAMLAAIKVRWYTFLLETWGLRPAKWQERQGKVQETTFFNGYVEWLRGYFLLSTALLPKIFRVVFVRMIAAARREKEGVYTQSALSQRSVVVGCLWVCSNHTDISNAAVSVSWNCFCLTLPSLDQEGALVHII